MLFIDIFSLLLLFLGYAFAALVSRDGADGTPANYYHWSGAGRFSEDAGTIDGQLPSLAKQAYEDMLNDAQDQGVAFIPSTMTALAVGSDVYFSSSLKGNAFLVNPGYPQDYVQEGVAEEVHTAIFRCQQHQSGETGEHRYDAKCGEPLACQQFLVNNPQSPLVGQGRVSTYGVLDPNNRDDVGILDPCDSKDGKWGCTIFVDKMSLKTLGNQGDKPGSPNITPTQELPHCFWTSAQ